MRQTITCSDCGEEGFLAANGLCGPCYKRVYHEEHREKILERSRRWREENRERHRAYSREWQHHNRERASARKYRWALNNPEKMAECRQRWKQEHPDKQALYKVLRRARKKNLPYTLTPEQAKHLLAVGQAVYPGEELHLDHIVPIAKGGGTTLANMHAIPASLNCWKHDALPEEVYRQGALI